MSGLKTLNLISTEDDFFKIYIEYPRQELIQKINLRTEQMIKNGAILEVKKFIKLKVRSDKSVNKAIGINEIKEHLNDGKIFKCC